MSRAVSLHDAGFALDPWRRQGPAQDKRAFVFVFVFVLFFFNFEKALEVGAVQHAPHEAASSALLCECSLLPWNCVRGCERK